MFISFLKYKANHRKTNASNGVMFYHLKMQNLLEIKDVTYSYSNQNEIISNFSLCLNSGEHIAIIGPNGKGKTTLLKIAAGLIQPASGQVLFDGSSTDAQDYKSLRPRISFLFQKPQTQIIGQTPFEDVVFGLKNTVVKKEEAKEIAKATLVRLNIEEIANLDSYSLSGGQSQMVAFAGAIATQPKLLLLDEPTSMLDAEFKVKMIEVTKELQCQGTAILSVSHDSDFLEHANKVITL
ncbi:MAG: ABC transporter ATP-binding protein [Phoenicibacter congonensis]|uniref:ABC transporter ATP-binding protein n=1 Tax=Phoenicibacter congonensis TaxID=1944646 RepID=A0AA43RIC7_9ACTN|nr:ABC transporter ATP-binding protein [Phoenicibacter congonensis]